MLLPALGASNLYIEYMDTKRFFGRDFTEQFPEIYRRRFASHHFDVIVATDNNAFDFLREHRDQLFPHVPVVFCGVNYFRDEDLRGRSLFTGVSEEADVQDTLDLALRLHPDTGQLYVVNEMTETGQTVHDEVVKWMNAHPGRVSVTFLEDYSMPDLLAALSSLPPASLVFYSFFSHDKTGRFFEYYESATAIAKASNAPVYGAWDFNLGLGIVGGKLISGFYQGVAAGKIALRVLQGENPDSIPVVRSASERPNRYMFDYRQLQRYGIPFGELPADSVIENQPESFLQKHLFWLLAGALLTLFLAAINFMLVMNIRRRKAAEQALWDQQDRLEELVASRSVQLENLNSRLRLDILKRENTEKALRESQRLLHQTFNSLRDALLIITAETRVIVDCNPATTKLFGYSREEVAGQCVRMLHVDQEAFLEFGRMAATAIRGKGYLRVTSFRMQRKNGEIFPTQHSVLPLYDEDGVLVSWVSVIRDITEEQRNEEKLEQYRRKLRKLAAELTLVEARERRQIAAELHENLGQLLATAKMKIAPMRMALADSALRESVTEVQGLVEEALQQTRSLTYQLSSPILYQLGLEAALKFMTEEIERRYGFRVTFTRLGESVTLPEETSVFLFSAVRELLVNVAKHACASEVAVRLRWLEDGVEVLVKDNGKGFLRSELAAEQSKDCFGLFHIHERVEDLCGRVWLRSEPRRGTAVKIHLPVGTGSQKAELAYEYKNSAGGRS